MARPAEKARAMLNKWVKMREEGNAAAPVRGKRPHLASECEHLTDAEYYRNQILREISSSISKIQNPALGEHTIRELNDEINKRLREKHHWNKRIKQLGGKDYSAIERQQQIEEGDTQSVEGPGGYRYFGAAKDLPGVQDLLEKQAAKAAAKKRSRGDIYKHIGPSYFGWRDEEDGVLLELEADSFQDAVKRQKKLATSTDQATTTGTSPKRPVTVLDLSDDALVKDDYLEVPSQDEIAQIMLEEKKKSLLAKFSF